jgi:UDP-galactopyranose mutase
LSNFTNWTNYKHKVFSIVDGKEVPVPFNLDSLEILFGKMADKYKEKLIANFGMGSRISIFALLENKDKDLNDLGKFVYKKIFYYYSKKQWGNEAKKIDKSVLERVPVNISYENSYFNDKHQGMPIDGFTKIIEKLLSKTEILLEEDYKKIINKITYDKLIVTAPIDLFFDYKFGKIKYRKAYFLEEKKPFPNQDNSVINYPSLKYKFTRVTEFNHFYNIKNKQGFTVKEFPSWKKGYDAWPIQSEKNLELVKKYLEEANNLKNVFFVGRLAEGRYLNIDQTINSALELYNKIK